MKNQNNKKFSFKAFLQARNTRRGAVSVAITVLIIVAVILLNVVVNSLTTRNSLYLDTTADKAYRLQSVTADYAASIKKDVDFYVLATEQDFEDAGDHYVQANKLIRQFCESGDHITLHYTDIITDPSFRRDYPDIDWSVPHPCLVVCGKNYRVIDADDMFDYEQDSSGYQYPTNQHVEQALASAVLAVTSDNIPTVAVLTGQGEEDASYFLGLLTNNAYKVATVDLTAGAIPDEADFLLIYAPAVDIDEEMYTYLSSWLTNNGSYGRHVVYFPSDRYDTAEYPNLNALLADYGMSVDYGYVRDYANPLLGAKWHGGFADGTLWTTTAVDESYEIEAEFTIPEGGKAGLFLFYNEEARFGVAGDAADGAGTIDFAVRIQNEQNRASLWTKYGDGAWTPGVTKDVSGFHHNNYNGFFALRPAYLIAGGAELKSFEYKPL